MSMLLKQEDIALVNIYTPKIGAPKYVKQILMDIKGEIDRNTDIIGDINTPMTSVYRFSRQKINKEAVTLNDTPDQMDLIDIFRAFHPKAGRIYILFKCTWNIF